MNNYRMYVLIEGEPFLSRVKEYRSKLEACRKAWRAFAQEKGASAICGGLTGLIFEGRHNLPDGWKVPNSRGWSRPKRGHPDEAVINALPGEPSRRDVFGNAICENLNYKGPQGTGFGAIGAFFFGPQIGWAGDVFFAVIPDAKKAAADHLAYRPDDTITSGADKWELPPGLVQITKAKMELIIAEFKVKWESA